MDLDPDAARAILEPYPELWEHWQREMHNPDREQKYGSGGVREMHDQVFLREVVRQHRWLTEGPGDRPDPALKRRLDEILEPCPKIREKRERSLANPWARAIGDMVAYWHDPEIMARQVNRALHPPDPFSPNEIRMRHIIELLKSGEVSMVMTEKDSGKEGSCAATSVDPDRARPAPTELQVSAEVALERRSLVLALELEVPVSPAPSQLIPLVGEHRGELFGFVSFKLLEALGIVVGGSVAMVPADLALRQDLAISDSDKRVVVRYGAVALDVAASIHVRPSFRGAGEALRQGSHSPWCAG